MLFIETDIGRDPDDLFALLYFVASEINIAGIAISPGDPDQIAIGRFISKIAGKDIPIIASQKDRNKSSANKFHREILKEHGMSLTSKADCQYINDFIKNDTDVFICGPPQAFGSLIREYNPEIKKLVIQGGFLSYEIHDISCQKLDKFIGQKEVSTFNLNGAGINGEYAVKANCRELRMVGKNLCHTIIYDQNIHNKICQIAPKNEAIEIIRSCMTKYLKKHKNGKKFHDPLAAVAYTNPEIFKWVRGDPYKNNGYWGTILKNDGGFIAADVNRDKFWDIIAHGG